MTMVKTIVQFYQQEKQNNHKNIDHEEKKAGSSTSSSSLAAKMLKVHQYINLHNFILCFLILCCGLAFATALLNLNSVATYNMTILPTRLTTLIILGNNTNKTTNTKTNTNTNTNATTHRTNTTKSFPQPVSSLIFSPSHDPRKLHSKPNLEDYYDMHSMDDALLLWRASRMVVPNPDSHNNINQNPKVAFMFLAKGPLHLAPLWERFFRGNQDLYTIYVHFPPNDNVSSSFPHDSVFYRRSIPSKKVQWGKFNMVEAERRLLANALLDPSNQRFVLLSDACIPLHNFSTIYSYLINSTETFVESYDLPGPVGRDRYSHSMKPVVTLSQWRKGSQWFQLDRTLALAIVSDLKYFTVFKKYCTGQCYGDEHYLPTLVSIYFSKSNSNRTLTWVDWSKGGPHPGSFLRPWVTIDFLESIRNIRTCDYNGEPGNICFLFARKFHPTSLSRLLFFAYTVFNIR